MTQGKKRIKKKKKMKLNMCWYNKQTWVSFLFVKRNTYQFSVQDSEVNQVTEKAKHKE